MTSSNLLFENETYKLRNAIFEVYKNIGSGFLEAVYQECLEKEFSMQAIPFESQVELTLNYKDQKLKQRYKPDFICFEKIIVEIKAINEISGKHKAQVINYLKATDMSLGLLVNFGAHPRVEIVRLINLDN